MICDISILTLFLIVVSTPQERRSFTAASLPLAAARCIGVHPPYTIIHEEESDTHRGDELIILTLSFADTSPPHSFNSSIAGVWPYPAAQCIGVSPSYTIIHEEESDTHRGVQAQISINESCDDINQSAAIRSCRYPILSMYTSYILPIHNFHGINISIHSCINHFISIFL